MRVLQGGFFLSAFQLWNCFSTLSTAIIAVMLELGHWRRLSFHSALFCFTFGTGILLLFFRAMGSSFHTGKGGGSLGSREYFLLF